MSTTVRQQTIRVSQGATELTWSVTVSDKDGGNITADTVKMSLGTSTAPGAWQDPTIISHPTESSVTVQLLVGSDTLAGAVNYPVGSYTLWVKINDNPETIIRSGERIVIV